MTQHTQQQGRLVCLSGRSGCGKDTVGQHLVAHHGFVRLAVADRIKWAAMELFDLGHDQLWGEGRNHRNARLGMAPRELYQRFGDACRQLDDQIWLRNWRRRTELLLHEGARVVCTDLRTVPEFKLAQNLGGELWRIERHQASAPGELGAHHTETALDGMTAADGFDVVIHNNGSLADLWHHVEEALRP